MRRARARGATIFETFPALKWTSTLTKVILGTHRRRRISLPNCNNFCSEMAARMATRRGVPPLANPIFQVEMQRKLRVVISTRRPCTQFRRCAPRSKSFARWFAKLGIWSCSQISVLPLGRFSAPRAVRNFILAPVFPLGGSVRRAPLILHTSAGAALWRAEYPVGENLVLKRT